jgi:hypothetical protein
MTLNPTAKLREPTTMLAPELSSDRQMLGEVVSASEQTKIEVWSRTDATGASGVELIEYAWGAGLGWYVQKRVALDGGQVALLHGLLGMTLPVAPAAKPLLHRPLAVREDNVIQLVFPA